MDDIRALILDEIPHLRRFGFALTRDKQTADDLVQDTLVRALTNLHGFRPQTNLRAWLFTIMRNRFVSDGRRLAVRRRLAEAEASRDQVAVLPSQGDSLALKELEAAVAELPEDQRTTLLLVGLEGLTYEEAAAVTDVPVGTVRSRLSRAREALRERLDHTTDNDRMRRSS